MNLFFGTIWHNFYMKFGSLIKLYLKLYKETGSGYE